MTFPGSDVICGLSLLVLYSALRGFSPGTPVFPSHQKPTLAKYTWDINKVIIINKIIIIILFRYILRNFIQYFYSYESWTLPDLKFQSWLAFCYWHNYYYHYYYYYYYYYYTKGWDYFWNGIGLKQWYFNKIWNTCKKYNFHCSTFLVIKTKK